MAQEWVPDDASNECMKCKSEFGFFNRKHHCRSCSLLLCGACSSKAIALPLQHASASGPLRVCNYCFTYESRRVAFESQHRPLLATGALFLKHPHARCGAPKSRYVRVSDDRTRLVWRLAEQARAADMPDDLETSLTLKQITSIKKGKGTPAFQRADAAGADESLCLSIVTDARTLDLQAVSEEVRNRWLSALHETLLFVHMNAPRDVRGDALIKMHDALSAAELQAARAADEARKKAERDQRQSRVDAMKQKYAR